jgi:predicted patatin/cPLA2 family phospholipase
MFKYLLLFISLLFLGCGSRPPAPPVEHAHILPWGAIDLDINSNAKTSIKHSLGKAIAQTAHKHGHHNDKVPYNILVLSGGGSRGAFGSGVVSGWNDRGDMPKFDIITGISTGSIMAPFIFVGGDALKQMNYFYTEKKTEEVFTDAWDRFFNGGYFMNAKPLKKLFIETFDEAFLAKVAQEHKNGRRLYVGTTNIDTGQLIVWDMGAIAASDKPDKYQRFSDIIYASTAMPVYLPPQYMEVDVDGQKYYQMHVDGGIYSQIFMIGLLTNWKEQLDLDTNANTDFDVTLYAIANRKYRQRDIYEPVEQEAFGIISAFVLTEMDLLFDRSMYRLYKSCEAKGINFKMVAIPEKMKDIVIDPIEFKPEQMMRLYNLAYTLGKNGVDWQESIALDAYDNHK